MFSRVAPSIAKLFLTGSKSIFLIYKSLVALKVNMICMSLRSPNQYSPHTPKYFCFYSVFITTKLSAKHHLESSVKVN